MPCSFTKPQDKSKDPVGEVDSSKINQMEAQRKAADGVACTKSSEALKQ